MERLTSVKLNLFKPKDADIAQREGIKIDKGAILTSQYLEKIEGLLRKYISFFTAYPDLFLDLIKPQESEFKLFFYQRIVLRAVMRFKEVNVTACVNGDTPILTDHGIVKIKDFNANWRVMSNGEWREVENLNIQNWNGKKIKLNADNCFYESIVTTDDHKFLAIPRKESFSRPGKFWKEGLDKFNIKNYEDRKEFYRTNLREVEPQWMRADQLSKEDWLLSKINTEISDKTFIEVPKAPSRTQNIITKENIYFDNDFCEWFGIWLAEGSWGKSRIDFTIADYEERLRDRIINLSQKIFGLVPAQYHRKEKHSLILSLQSAHLTELFKKLYMCEHKEVNQYTKYVPEYLMQLTPNVQLQIVKGWLDGDGYYRKPNNSSRYKGTTVSGRLVEDMKMILYRNFINPSITVEHRRQKAIVYNLCFNGKLAGEFEEAILQNRPVSVSTEMRLGEYYPIKTANGLYMRNRICSISTIEDDCEDVYCLQLENGQFNVCGIEGHNCRAFSKSFISILGIFLQCIFMPGTKRFICAPAKNQSAQIAKEKILEIYEKWPLLKQEIEANNSKDTPGNFGKDYVTLRFKNGSQFDVVGALDSARGGRRHGGLIDEIRDHEERPLNEIVLPLLNVSRRLPDNTVNENEVNQQTIAMTSAGVKTSFAYDKLIDMFEKSIINPKSAFVFGCDYRVPVLHGLLDKDFISDLKMSPSFNEDSFAREYASIWSGSSEESWFNFEKISKYRKLKNPEKHKIDRPGSIQFYLLSVDVGRLSDQTVVCVHRVNVVNGKYHSSLVNIFVLGKTASTKPFSIQARDLKEIIELFQPKEVVVDTNGLGVGLADELIRTQMSTDGHILPAYGFKNDDNYKKIQPKDAPQILYGIKANGPLNSKIHGTCYSRISSGLCRFLIKEQEAKSALLSTKVGQKMSIEQRVERLMPHEMTTRLFEEMANLRLKRTGSGVDIVLERINERYPKDKYSAYSYGLWRIKELEEEEYQKRKRRGNTGRKLVFFT